MAVLRSHVFNAVFFVWTAICCIGLLWMLLLPKRGFLAVIRWYLRSLAFFERGIIGLDYRVVGREHVPAGACIIAAKHQSTWETMKLHLLFDDPSVVLKRELMWLPVWGWYAAKADLIPVNRGGRSKAIASMVRGARRMVRQHRPIVIFPQGTRVAAGVYAPYRIGIAALYDALDVPVVPMALNSGVFWPRRSHLKRPGTITVEFLEPIPPGLPREEFLLRLEHVLERASDRLVVAEGGPATLAPEARTVDRSRANAAT
ncbi:MAG TPA: lysophospholipid acyltransferase family protein [Alphaproteobacteria bacterium]|nr:lysophospholipid acyltransferase family protein [Alphaproteobacteria bacterium]